MTESRVPNPTVGFIDDYCQWSRDLFVEVRSFEAFKYLHLGMVSDIKRKSLPALAKIVGLDVATCNTKCPNLFLPTFSLPGLFATKAVV